MSSLRERRVANEWFLLLRAAESNTSVLEIEGRHCAADSDTFRVRLGRTDALVKRSSCLSTVSLHRVSICFPEFFPAVPIQVFLGEPVVHPNVNPFNGFVCLWDRFSPGDSSSGALRQLQRVITWELFNPSQEHLMQPDAFDLHSARERLAYAPLQLPVEAQDASKRYSRAMGRYRSRLSKADS